MSGILEQRAVAAAQRALERVAQQAEQQGWSLDQLEQAKQRVALDHDVTLCDTKGCLQVVTAAAGYFGLRCQQCEARE